MSNKKQGTVKIFKVVSYVIIVLLLVGLCGFLAYFTNGLTTDFKSFYVVVNDRNILTSASGYQATPQEPLSVEIKYTFGFMDKEMSGYKVKIMPKSDEVDFFINVDNVSHKFSEIEDITVGFDIVLKENSFTITPKGNLIDILNSVYSDNEISVDEGSIDYSKDLFTAIITSYNDEAKVYIHFNVRRNVTGIVLDTTEVIF